MWTDYDSYLTSNDPQQREPKYICDECRCEIYQYGKAYVINGGVFCRNCAETKMDEELLELPFADKLRILEYWEV